MDDDVVSFAICELHQGCVQLMELLSEVLYSVRIFSNDELVIDLV